MIDCPKHGRVVLLAGRGCSVCANLASEQGSSFVVQGGGGGWSFARCPACTKTGRYPNTFDRGDTEHCASCKVRLHPLVTARLTEIRRKEGSLPAITPADVAAMMKQCIPPHTMGESFTAGLISGNPVEALMPAPGYACHEHYRALGPDGKCPECRAEQRSVRPDRGKVPVPGVSIAVTDPDGTKRVVPDPEGDGRTELEYRAKLAADCLDRLDREQPPGHAVTLPGELAGMAWHTDWARYRRAYILGDDAALARMASYVTTANPPSAYDVAKLAPKPAPVARKRAVSFTPEGVEFRLPGMPGLRPDQRVGLLAFCLMVIVWSVLGLWCAGLVNFHG